MPVLFLNGTAFTQQDIIAQKEAGASFEKNTLAFCRRYLLQEDIELTSSGSTGQPKVFRFTHPQFQASAQITINALGLHSKMNALLCLDPKYIAGQMMIARSLEAKMPLYAVEPCANPFEKVSEEIHFAAFAPYQLQTILNSAQAEKLKPLKAALIGGAPWNKSHSAPLEKYAGQFFETYGMTETLTHVALRDAKKNDSYFQVLPAFTIRQDERQCLVIEASHLSEQAVTNDVVQLVSERQFQWLGRYDNVINSGGIKIFPEQTEEEIRHLLSAANIAKEFFIRSVPHADFGNAVEMVVENPPVEKDVIAEALRPLEFFKKPKQITFANFIRTETGKVQRELSAKNLR